MNFTTFTTALSGLNANAQGLSVVGNNLANVNTTGFKESAISFVDVLGQANTSGIPGTGSINLGLGTQVESVRQNFGEGSIQTTNNPLDVAIQGRGFIALNGSSGRAYTRAGNLRVDQNQKLVADNGMAVQGYVRNPLTGNVDPNLGVQDIQMPTGVESPIKTTQFQLTMNLDGGALSGTQFTTSIQVFDSIGTAHIAKITLQKDVAPGPPPVTRWRFDVTIPKKETAGASPTDPGAISLITGRDAVTPIAPPSCGTLVFDSGGKLQSAYLGADPGTLPPLADLQLPATGATFPAMVNGGALNPNITWKLLNPDRSSNVTGYANASDVSFSYQDGAGSGSISSISVLPDGTVSGVFTNGKTVDFAQIVLAQFGNVDGLIPAGGGLYQESLESGAAFVGVAGTGGRGRLIGGALEQSNVDLATELTKIIIYQRGYQANAKLITTTDQLLQQTMQMMQ